MMIQREYAAALYAKVKAAITKKLEDDATQNENLQFNQSAAAPHTPNDTSDFSQCIIPNSPMASLLNYASLCQWRTPTCRPKQIQSVDKISFEPSSDGKLIVIDRTGGGKSHILRMIATMVGGIIVVIVPLLLLTADQMIKIKVALQDFGSVEAHNLDDLSLHDLRTAVIPRMKEINYDSSSTMFLFTSPQYLANNSIILDAILQCHALQTLRLIAIDEAHIYAMHGRTFREAMRILQKIMFERIYKVGGWHPLFLAMTATMTLSLLSSFAILTNVDWTLKHHQLWSTAGEFRRRYIYFGLHVMSTIGKGILDSLIDLLKRRPTACAFIFVNFVTESAHWAELVEDRLTEAHVPGDVIIINGHMDKHEKFSFVRLLTRDITLEDYLARICVATAAANTGIDQKWMEWIDRIGLPRDVLTMLQEMGRNARQPGMTGAYHIYTDWKRFVKLLLSILIPLKKEGEEPPEYEGLNSVIPSKTKEKRVNNIQHQSGPRSPLTRAQIHNNTIDAYHALMDILILTCLPYFGCIHTRSEWLLAQGEMTPPPEVFLGCGETEANGPQCFVCDGKYKQYLLPVVFSGAIKFLKSQRFMTVLRMVLTVQNCEDVIDCLYSDKDWCICVFGVSSVKKYNVTAFIFQLLATKLLTFEIINRTNVICVLARSKQDMYDFLYEDPLAWEGFEFCRPTRGAVPVSLMEIVIAVRNAQRMVENI